MRLIDADTLKVHICNMCDDGQRECKGDNSCAILVWVNDMQTVDAVPVVRCGECKYMRSDGKCTMFADDNIRPSVSDFCSYGEKSPSKA